MAKRKAPAKRSRTGSDVTSDTAVTQGLSTGDPRDPKKRGKRVPLQAGMNLDVHDFQKEDEDYYYRWFSERPEKGGRTQKAQAAFYEFVHDHDGNPIKRPSGSGFLYLMRLPKEFREEDLERKRESVRRTMRDQTKLGKNEYNPDDHGSDSSVSRREETDNPYAA